MTDIERQDALHAHAHGESIPSIARRLGLTPSTVGALMQRTGVHHNDALKCEGWTVPPKGASGPVPTIPQLALPPDPCSEAALLKMLKKGGRTTVADIADRLDVSPRRVRETLEALRSGGAMVEVEDGDVSLLSAPRPAPPSSVDLSLYKGEPYRFAVIADTHLCSKYACLGELGTFYDLCADSGVRDVYLAGNYIDGEARFNTQDIHVHGLGRQVDYFIENYPRRDGITTHYVAGDDHEGWYQQREGVNVGEYTALKAREAGRTDLQYLGYMEHDVRLEAAEGHATMRIVHAGGGSAYAVSYTTQKLIESYTGGEKPNILVVGHYHKSEFLPSCRNVFALQAGCFEKQTPFMRKKKLAAHIGGWLCDVVQAPDGSVMRFRAEWIPFYGGEDVSAAWEYKD